MYVVLSNHLGEADGRHLCGHSSIYGPAAELLADAGPSDEGLAVATSIRRRSRAYSRASRREG